LDEEAVGRRARGKENTTRGQLARYAKKKVMYNTKCAGRPVPSMILLAAMKKKERRPSVQSAKEKLILAIAAYRWRIVPVFFFKVLVGRGREEKKSRPQLVPCLPIGLKQSPAGGLRDGRADGLVEGATGGVLARIAFDALDLQGALLDAVPGRTGLAGCSTPCFGIARLAHLAHVGVGGRTLCAKLDEASPDGKG
jgi:hypothetical protein